MSAYGVGITPLFKLSGQHLTVKQAEFADNLIGAEKLLDLRKYWNNVNKYGPPLGYNPKDTKSWLVVKDELLVAATQISDGTNINITSQGRKYLGSCVGAYEARLQYANSLVTKWMRKRIPT